MFSYHLGKIGDVMADVLALKMTHQKYVNVEGAQQ